MLKNDVDLNIHKKPGLVHKLIVHLTWLYNRPIIQTGITTGVEETIKALVSGAGKHIS